MRTTVLAFTALLALLPGIALAQSPISGEVPSEGVALVVWGGGSVEEVAPAAAEHGCTLISVWSSAGGILVGYVPGAPPFVNAVWVEQVPEPLPAEMPLLLVCGTPSPVESTGIESVDAAIAAALEGDAHAFAALMRTQQVPCSTQGPFGQPPPACEGQPPETVVEVFPESTCELEIDESDVLALAQRWLPRVDELYAVVHFDEPVFEPAPYLPEGTDYGVIFTGEDIGGFAPGLMAVIYEDAVVFLDTACVGGPEVFFEAQGRYGTPEVIFEGPAFGEAA